MTVADNSLALGRPTAVVAVGAGVLAKTGLDFFTARTVGATEFAVYALLLAIAAIASGLVVMGLPGVALELVPRLRGLGQAAQLRSFERVGTGMALGAGLVVGAVIWAVLLVVDAYAYARPSAWLLLLLVPASAWLVFQRQLGLLSDRPLAALFSATSTAALTGLLLVAVFALPIGVAVIVGASGTASLLVAGVLRHGYRRDLGGMSGAPAAEPGAYRLWLTGGLVVLSANFATVLTLQADVVLIGFFATPSQAGAYALGSRLSIAVTLGLAAVIARDGRRMGQELASSGDEALWSAFLRARRSSAILSVGLGLGLLSLAYPVLGAFGPEFTVAAPWFAVLILSRMCSGITGPVAEYLIIAGRSPAVSGTALIGLVTTVTTIVGLGAAIGALGVAVGTLIGTVVTNLLQVLAARRHHAVRAVSPAT